MMNRRQALAAMINALGLAGSASVFGASVFDIGTAPAPLRPVLSSGEVALLNEVADTILPDTEGSPGAKAADVGAFMQDIVSRYYSLEEQQTFLFGLAEFDELCRNRHQKNFIDLSSNAREQLLLELEAQPGAVYYQMIKQLTLWGYFSSETGTKKALRFAPIPGRYDGDVKIQPGTKAWADIGA